MIQEEKYLLLECLLKDIRLDWGDSIDKRLHKALELSKDLELVRCQQEITDALEHQYDRYFDGRMFRKPYTMGGYEGLGQFYSQDIEVETEFIELFDDLIYCPEFFDITERSK